MLDVHVVVSDTESVVVEKNPTVLYSGGGRV